MQTTLGILHKFLSFPQERKQSCTDNNISRAVTSFDNLETTCFISEAALKYTKTYLWKEM